MSLSSRHQVDLLLEEMRSRPIILMGEASHGSKEFHEDRIFLTQRLLQEQEDSSPFIALEWDWSDCARLNRYVHGRDPHLTAKDVLLTFSRWPQWMWANEEVATFIEWLRRENTLRKRKVSIYGVDLFGLQRLISETPSISSFFEECRLNPSNNEQHLTPPCLEELLQTPFHSSLSQSNELYNISQLQKYIQIDDNNAWNFREQHMFNVFSHLMKKHGRGIFWGHNTHVGNAFYSDMKNQGLQSLSSLLLEFYGSDNVFTLGGATFEGTVLAGVKWGGPTRIMTVPPAPPGSWEYLWHQESPFFSKIIYPFDFPPQNRGLRAIGAVYSPETDFQQFIPTTLPGRFDAMLYFETTSALHPLSSRFSS